MTEAQVVHRRADWFELFFDLVFVVTVAVLAHGLHGDPGWRDFGEFLILFFPAWWAWVNLMVSVNLFGSTLGWNRLMLMAAMPGLGVMAAAAPEGLGDRAWAYALGAAWVRLMTFAIWWRQVGPETGVPAWRPISYALLPAGLWVASVIVPGPARFALWAVAIGIEVALLAIGIRQSPDYNRVAVDHLVERIGLFVVIVLGESVFTVVTGLSQHFTVLSAVAALGAFVTVATLATAFFRWSAPDAERGIARARMRDARASMRDAVMYLPFLLVSAITILAAALGTAVDEPDHHLPTGSLWGLAGGLAGCYAANALMARRLGDSWRTMAGWLVPGLVLPLAVLLPLALILPAWAAALVTAGVVLAHSYISKLTKTFGVPTRRPSGT